MKTDGEEEFTLDRQNLNEHEIDIWKSAYACGFVTEFRKWQGYQDVNLAAATTTAELAMEIADLAVIRLRQWVMEEGDNAPFHVF
jgi:hypothetical protein